MARTYTRRITWEKKQAKKVLAQFKKRRSK